MQWWEELVEYKAAALADPKPVAGVDLGGDYGPSSRPPDRQKSSRFCETSLNPPGNRVRLLFASAFSERWGSALGYELVPRCSHARFPWRVTYHGGEASGGFRRVSALLGFRRAFVGILLKRSRAGGL